MHSLKKNQSGINITNSKKNNPQFLNYYESFKKRGIPLSFKKG